MRDGALRGKRIRTAQTRESDVEKSPVLPREKEGTIKRSSAKSQPDRREKR